MATEQKSGFFQRLRAKLNPPNSWLSYDLGNLFSGRKIDAAILEELESRLLGADVGVTVTEELLETLRKQVARKELADVEALIAALREAITATLRPVQQPLAIDAARKPFVILVVGVNGSGKTTTIGKLARRFADDGRSVLLAAGDTFRAAAVEQLSIWADRAGVELVAQQAEHVADHGGWAWLRCRVPGMSSPRPVHSLWDRENAKRHPLTCTLAAHRAPGPDGRQHSG